MKKVFLLVLVVVIVTLSVVLAGCGGGATKEGSEGSKTQNNQDAAAQDEGKVASDSEAAKLFAKAAGIEGIQFDYEMNTGSGIEMKGTMWIKGKHTKSEMTVANQRTQIIIDGDANAAYTYLVDQNIAMEMPIEKLQGQSGNSPLDYAGQLDMGATKIIGTDVVDGARCKVVESKNNSRGETMKMWVREDNGIPVRVEVYDDGKKTVTVVYKNLKIGPISDDIFKLPEGAENMGKVE